MDFALAVFLIVVGVVVAMLIGIYIGNRLARPTDETKKPPPDEPP
jgi:uncharacterized protein YneF (UPF0154 family)